MSLAPLPVQRPRVPVWIGGTSRAAQRRAARWDGWIIGGDDDQGQMIIRPERAEAEIAYVRQHRTAGGPFDFALTGISAAPGDAVFSSDADAGVTWWLEHIHGRRGAFSSLLARISAGPPAPPG